MDFFEMLMQEMDKRRKQKAAGTPTFIGPFAPTGLFAPCGFEDALITAFVGPGTGIIDRIPWYPSLIDKAQWQVLTDVVEAGTEPTSDCAKCPTATLRVCDLEACFGQYCRSTEELSLLKLMDRQAGATQRRLIGGLVGLPQDLSWSNGQPLDVQDLLVVGLGVSLRHQLQDQAWQGNSTLTAPPGYDEMNGLERLVNNGLVDAFNGAACPGIDADVKVFNACLGDAGAPSLYAYLAQVRRMTHYRASRAQMNPNQLVQEIWMREELWPCVAQQWPLLQYAAVNANTYGEEAMLRRYEEILSRQALPIDGVWVPVYFDSGITGTWEHAGERFRSDIFFLTTQFDREPFIYGEHVDLRQGLAALSKSPIFAKWASNAPITPIDGGRFLAAVMDFNSVCIDATVWVRPRILVKAPWLCGRVTGVCCRPLQPFPGPDYPGFVPGGHHASTPPSTYGACYDGVPR